MKTFVEILRARAQEEPEACAFAFLAGDGGETRLTYGQLDQRARALAALLQQNGASGERVLIALHPGLDYVVAIFGCMFAGSTLVPCALPRRAERASQLRAIAIDSGAKFAIGSEDPDLASLKWLAANANLEQADLWREPPSSPHHVALLQYTSGSTASPRGVMVTHANLIANARSIEEGFQHTRRAWGVTWLPPYHDMGLMGGILQPVYFDAPSAVISPLDFVRRPIIWLEAISRYRARTSGGPNFAYDLCARTITAADSSSLQLDCWVLAYVGAEPVRAATLDLFAKTFAPCGFKREFFFPCYGLAEATLYVSGGRPRMSGSLVSCGRPASELKVSIEGGSIGQIRVSGPSVSSGYWNRPEDTRSTFEGDWLRTGDLGFIQDGELFVTGRFKDLIIIRGRNHYPQDIEDTVAGTSRAIRPGSCAAFSVDSGSEEKLVLILEMPRPRPEKLDVLRGDIREAVARNHELQVSAIVFVRPGAIPRTSSGKVQRLECRDRYVSGALRSLTTI